MRNNNTCALMKKSEPKVNNEFRTAQKRNRTRKALFLQASKHQIVVPSGS